MAAGRHIGFRTGRQRDEMGARAGDVEGTEKGTGWERTRKERRGIGMGWTERRQPERVVDGRRRGARRGWRRQGRVERGENVCEETGRSQRGDADWEGHGEDGIGWVWEGKKSERCYNASRSAYSLNTLGEQRDGRNEGSVESGRTRKNDYRIALPNLTNNDVATGKFNTDAAECNYYHVK